MQKSTDSNPIYLLFALAILFIYILGSLYPDIFWGTHFLSFLPPIAKYGFILFPALFFGLIYTGKAIPFKLRFYLNRQNIIIITSIMFIIFYNLDIVGDYYGDAKNFNPYLEQKFSGFKNDFWRDLFSIKIETGHARWGVFNFYSLIAYILNINLLQCFKLMDAIFGAGFIFIWLLLIKRNIKNIHTAFIFLLIGCSAPVLLIFCGHIETYGFVLFLLMTWIYIYVRAFEEKKTFLLWVLIPLFLICLRFNTPSFIVFPALVLAFINHYGGTKTKNFTSLKNLFRFIFIPLVLIGLYIYFIFLEDHINSRILDTNTKDIERLFLPLFSPPAPLDTYNLFSWNHIFDFLMSFSFWSPGLLFVVLIILYNSKEIKWSSSLVNIFLLTFLLFIGFLFMVNPLMSLPMDWDLYTLPFPFLLVLLLLIFQKNTNIHLHKSLLHYIIALQVLIIPSFIVCMNKNMHSHRIESVGVRVYKTYYQHSDNYLLYSLQMLEGNKTYSYRKNRLLKKLSPFVRKPIDQNYAALLLDEGINTFYNKEYVKSRALLLSAENHAPYLKLTREYLIKVNNILNGQQYNIPKKDIRIADSLMNLGISSSRQFNKFNEALNFYQRASLYTPSNPQVDILEMETYFLKKDYKNALKKAEKLISLKFPNKQQSLRFAIHCALETNAYEKALEYTTVYLTSIPEDKFIKSIHDNLKNNENLSELKYKFAKIKK